MGPNQKLRKPDKIHYLKVIFFLFLSFLILVIALFTAPRLTNAEEVQVQNSGGNAQVYGEDGDAEPAGQLPPEQIGDIQEEPPSFLDLETIPESHALPIADWVFEVPLSVQNILENLEMWIICNTYNSYPNGGSQLIGRGRTQVPLVEGAYEGNVLVGVQWIEGRHTVAAGNYYYCAIYLCPSGQLAEAISPTTQQVHPSWRWADADQPFRYYSRDYIGSSD